jgi:uracil-DNA glycosylase
MISIEELDKQIKDCTKCDLCKARIQAVPGDGSFKADILFIGEAPGAREDEKGIPFCGPAGKFLDELLSSISLSRKDIYITNMVKCRPPSNRDPEPEEIETCRDWLDKQIELINPKIIVVLGRHSMAKFMPNKKISQIHGKVFRQKEMNRFIVAFYHPAVALYNGSMRKVLLDDFQVLKKVLDGKINIPPEVTPSDQEIKFTQESLF